jgi:hypothetical protein
MSPGMTNLPVASIVVALDVIVPPAAMRAMRPRYGHHCLRRSECGRETFACALDIDEVGVYTLT